MVLGAVEAMLLIVGHRTPHSPPQADQIIRRAHTILIRFHCDVAILNALWVPLFFLRRMRWHTGILPGIGRAGGVPP